jgi:hypothetical protein
LKRRLPRVGATALQTEETRREVLVVPFVYAARISSTNNHRLPPDLIDVWEKILWIFIDTIAPASRSSSRHIRRSAALRQAHHNA